jgi:hypothetical protein
MSTNCSRCGARLSQSGDIEHLAPERRGVPTCEELEERLSLAWAAADVADSAFHKALRELGAQQGKGQQAIDAAWALATPVSDHRATADSRPSFAAWETMCTQLTPTEGQRHTLAGLLDAAWSARAVYWKAKSVMWDLY